MITIIKYFFSNSKMKNLLTVILSSIFTATANVHKKIYFFRKFLFIFSDFSSRKSRIIARTYGLKAIK